MEDQPWLPAQAGLSRLRRWHKVAWVVLCASALATVGSCAGVASAAGLLLFFFPGMLGLLAASVVVGMSERPTVRAGVFAVVGERLLLNVDGVAHSVSRGTLENAWVEEPAEMHLQTRDGWHVTLAPKDPAQLDEVARALGVGVEARVMRVELTSAPARYPGGTVLSVLGAVMAGVVTLTMAMAIAGALSERAAGSSDSFVPLVVTVVTMMLAAIAVGVRLVRGLRRPELVVGADGISLTRPKVTVPLSDIARIQPDPRGLVIMRTNGARVFLPTWTHGEPKLSVSPDVPDPPSPGARLRRTIFDRIEEARSRGGEGRGARAAMLDRGTRDLSAWLATLRALPSGAAGFRGGGISEEELEGVIADGTADAERRVGAAVALAAREPDRARARVRVAAEVCADARLRVALERAAEGELDEEYFEKSARRGR